MDIYFHQVLPATGTPANIFKRNDQLYDHPFAHVAWQFYIIII
jgi:hypothetical protein